MSQPVLSVLYVVSS